MRSSFGKSGILLVTITTISMCWILCSTSIPSTNNLRPKFNDIAVLILFTASLSDCKCTPIISVLQHRMTCFRLSVSLPQYNFIGHSCMWHKSEDYVIILGLYRSHVHPPLTANYTKLLSLEQSWLVGHGCRACTPTNYHAAGGWKIKSAVPYNNGV